MAYLSMSDFGQAIAIVFELKTAGFTVPVTLSYLSTLKLPLLVPHSTLCSSSKPTHSLEVYGKVILRTFHSSQAFI